MIYDPQQNHVDQVLSSFQQNLPYQKLALNVPIKIRLRHPCRYAFGCPAASPKVDLDKSREKSNISAFFKAYVEEKEIPAYRKAGLLE